MNSCIRCWITGRVQGVWFRDSTRTRARQLQLTGYANNLADGRVEVLACGAAPALAELKAWLRRGPPLARVTEVRCEDDPMAVATDDFTIG